MAQLKPFWNNHCKEISNKLWLPSKPNCKDINLSLPSTPHSWFTIKTTTLDDLEIKENKLYSQKLISSSKKTMNSVLPQIKNVEKFEKRSHKIRIYPTKGQKQELEKYFGTYRFLYNYLVEHFNKKSEDVKIDNLKDMRSTLINKNSTFTKNNIWLNDIGYNFKDEALRDFTKAKNTVFSQMKSGLITHFKLGFKSKKNMIQSFSLCKKDWNKQRGPLSKLFSTKSLRIKEKHFKLNHDTRVLKNKLGHYYICFIFDVRKNEKQVFNHSKVVALDPGVRTFLTGYDPNGIAFELGKNDYKRIFRLCQHLDKLLSKVDCTNKKRTKKSLLKASYRMRLKIKNLIDELHRKTSLFLCTNYKTILMPTFETSQMVDKVKRKIRKKTVRNLLNFRFYTFKQRLKFKAFECDSFVVDCTEEFTSQTCTNCGTRKKFNGKTMKCEECKFVGDRDVNAARNILIKYLKEQL